jgi:hypothetical protein
MTNAEPPNQSEQCRCPLDLRRFHALAVELELLLHEAIETDRDGEKAIATQWAGNRVPQNTVDEALPELVASLRAKAETLIGFSVTLLERSRLAGGWRVTPAETPPPTTPTSE